MPAEAHGIVAEVVWKDRIKDRSEPKSFVLFHDAQLSGTAPVTTFPEQEGAFLAAAFAQTDNEGNLVPYVSGTWDETNGAQTTPTDFVLQVLRTGSLWNSGEWGYRYDTDDEDQYRGSEDMRWVHGVHAPFGSSANYGSSHAIGYSRAFNRIVCGYYPTGGTKFVYVSRSAANEFPDGWGATQEINFGPSRSPTITGSGYSSIVELPDGALRWAYSYIPDNSGAPLSHDIDILGSTDGGQTWELVKEGVLTELWGGTRLIEKFTMAVSGDWLRLEVWDGSATTQGLVSAVSSDRAATWTLVEGHNDGDGLDNIASPNDSHDGFEWWDICGVDSAGTFLRVRRTASAAKLRYEIASRDGGWDQIPGTTSVYFLSDDTDCQNVWCAGGGGRAWVLAFRSDAHAAATGADGWSIGSFIIPTDRLMDGWNSSLEPRIDAWARWGDDDWLGYSGVARVHPKNGRLVWVGDRLALFTGGIDRQSGSSYTDWKNPQMSYIGGATRRSLRWRQTTHFDMTGNFLTGSWHAGLGTVGTTGAMTSSFDPFTTGNVGTPTISWSPGRQRVQLDATDYENYSRSKAIGGLLTFMADNGCLGFTTKAEDGSIPATAFPPGAFTAPNLRHPRWGARVQSASGITAGLTLDVSIHINGNGALAVYDVSGLTTLYEAAAGTLAGITSGDWYDFRLGCAHSSALDIAGSPELFVEVAWAKSGDHPWTSTGLLTIVGGSPLATSFEVVGFGHWSTPLASSTMLWREFFYNEEDNLGQAAFTNPDTLRGWDCLPVVQRVGQGHDVLWGGAGGFRGDTYEAPVRYEYGVGKLFNNSPSSVWRSSSSAAQTLVLDATLYADNDNDRFVHSGMAGISTNSRFIDLAYADDAAFTYPATMRIDGGRYGGIIDSTAEPTAIRVEDGVWQDGELAGHYLRAEPGAVANPGILRIVSNNGEWIHLAGMTEGGTLASYGLTDGVDITIWGTQHLLPYEDWPDGVRVTTVAGAVDGAFPRFLRVVIPDSADQGEPPGGRWHMGKLHAGLTLPITVPLAWESVRDDEEPNVDLQQLPNGVRVSYERGDPRRVWSGTSEGDTERWRVAFRSMVKSLGGYSHRPVVLCTDDLQPQVRALYARFTASTELANAGWCYNPTSARWERMGDMKVTFEQEL